MQTAMGAFLIYCKKESSWRIFYRNRGKFMERDFKIIHYNRNPPLTPPKRGLLYSPLGRGKGWVMNALIAMKICCQDLQ